MAKGNAINKDTELKVTSHTARVMMITGSQYGKASVARLSHVQVFKQIT